MKSHKAWLILIIILVSGALFRCNRSQQEQVEKELSYLNLHDTVDYVGMQTCRQCHASIYESFIKTGMGQSFGIADKEKSAAIFDQHALVYDTINDFYYKPFWKEDSLHIHEFRLEKNDTVHSRIEVVDYIIGSGQHTNSHICSFNGYLYQAPITFYTQSERWDLAPGFEEGFNSRFTRMIGFECMTCHNAIPDFNKKSMNKYTHVPLGINCERCHGPGELHVNQKMAGILIDTATTIDNTIVNPKDLSKELQMSVCQRCHLQGIAVLNEGKEFDDFKPGMHLSEVMNVFLPEFDNRQNNFLMASHVERLEMSPCYKNSDMSCITCHNPHISVKYTSTATFNNKCSNCHNNDDGCTAPIEMREKVDNNCSGCHMPKSGSIDIPHVFITDHYITIPEKREGVLEDAEIENIERFLGLKCYTNDTPSNQTMAKGYLAFFEKFSPWPYLLDSAASYIALIDKRSQVALNLQIHHLYLMNDFSGIINKVNTISSGDIRDDWTLYRVGESFLQLGDHELALPWFEKAVSISPFNLDFQNKLGAALVATKQYGRAKEVYQFVLEQQPVFTAALSNLGYLYMLEGAYDRAAELIDKAIALDPDYELALMNKAGLLIQQRDYSKAREYINRILKINPDNMQANEIVKKLKLL